MGKWGGRKRHASTDNVSILRHESFDWCFIPQNSVTHMLVMQHTGTEWHKEKDSLMHYICRIYKLPQMSKNLSQTMLSRCLKFPLTQQLKKIYAFLKESGTCWFAATWNHWFRGFHHKDKDQNSVLIRTH